MKNKPYSIILWILLSLFCFRVFGQLIQSFFPVAFLPSFDDWHSGTLPYPLLVSFQFAIIIIFSYTCIRISKGLINPMTGKGKKILVLGSIYAIVMLARCFLRMYTFPTERWFGGCIPILFHLILALFIMTLGLYHVQAGRKSSIPSNRMIKFSWAAFLVFIFTMIPVWIFYQLFPSLLASELGIRDSEYSVAIDKNIKIETDDGEILRADLYRPERIDKAPTILVRIPLDDNLKGKFMSNMLGRLWAELVRIAFNYNDSFLSATKSNFSV